MKRFFFVLLTLCILTFTSQSLVKGQRNGHYYCCTVISFALMLIHSHFIYTYTFSQKLYCQAHEDRDYVLLILSDSSSF